MIALDKLDYGIVISMTSFTGSYDQIPKKYRYEYYYKFIIENLLKFQKQQIEKNVKTNCFLIINDGIGSVNFNSKIMDKFFTIYRYYNISLLIMTQYIYKIPLTLRECVSFLCIFKQN